MIDFDVAFDKLASLETADEIAVLISDFGVKGEPKDARSCAISVWMTNQTGLTVATTTHVSEIHTRGFGYNRSRPMTSAMKSFMVGFDTGKYPNLVREQRKTLYY